MREENKEVEFKPAETFVISDLETLKAISDPVRMQIIDTILRKPRTVKEISKILKTNPTRLYYHINLLETYKLVQVVKTRIVSGVIEKSYQAVTTNFSLAFNLFEHKDAEADEKIKAYLSSIFNRATMEMTNSFKAGLISLGKDEKFRNANLLLASRFARVSPDRVTTFRQKLNDLIDEFDQLDDVEKTTDTQNYSFLIGLYPTLDLSTIEPDNLKDK